MITKVVVPLDGSKLAERAVAPGCALAERTDTPLVLLASHWDDDVDTPRNYLEKAAADLSYERVETRLIHDRVAAAAILTETGDPGTVLSMATHGRSGIGEVLLGSVAEEVLRRSDCPVLLAGPGLERGAWQSEQWFAEGKLLVTIDGSAASEAVVPVAADWSDLLALEPRVVQVVVVAGGMVLERDEGAGAGSAVQRVAASLTRGARAAQGEVLHGSDVAALILDYANRLPATLIAMATHGRTGLARVTLGSVAMQVVHRSPCPVLVVRSRLTT
jgi:nucleotide-binding universal stress UspA family protein